MKGLTHSRHAHPIGPGSVRKLARSVKPRVRIGAGVLLVLLVTSASAAILSPSSPPSPPRLAGVDSFGDTLDTEFQQGWRNGTDAYGLNDHIVPRDDFDGSYIDPNTWTSFGDSRGLASHRNSSARHEILSPGTTENNSISALRAELTGDFDLMIDFTLTDWANSFGMGAFLGVCPASTGCASGPPYLAGRANFSGTESYVGYDPPSGYYEIPTTDQFGTLRLARAGSVLESSFWNQSAGVWTVLYTNSTAPTEDLMLLFGIHENDTDPTPTGPVSVEFDNLSGDATISSSQFAPPGGAPVIDAVRLLPFNDNFDDGFRNPDRWADPVLTDATTAETAGGLNQTCSDSGGLENAVQSLRETLTGDFDARVEFNLATVPLTGTWRAVLGAVIDGLDYQMNRARGGGNQRYEAWAAGVLGNTALTSDVFGDLRLERVGTTLTFYYGGVGFWIPLQSSTVTTLPATISLRIRCTGAPYPPLSVEFDHFQIAMDRGMAPVTYVDATFESRVIDTTETAPGQPKWGDLFFNTTSDPDTSVRFQLASSDSPAGPWTFTGPDFTPATWYTSSGVPAILVDGDQYFRYRAELNSTNATSTPVLWDVAVTASGPNIPEIGVVGLAVGTALIVGLMALGRTKGRHLRRPQATV